MEEPKHVDVRVERLEKAVLLMAERLSVPPLYINGALHHILLPADYLEIKELIVGAETTPGQSTQAAGQPDDTLGRGRLR